MDGTNKTVEMENPGTIAMDFDGKTRLIRYESVNFMGTRYVDIIDKNGKQYRFHYAMYGEDVWTTKSDISKWPDEFLKQLYQIFNMVTPINKEPRDVDIYKRVI